MTTLKPRTATIVLYQGDDMTRLTELRRAAETARQFAAIAVAERDDAKEALAAHDATAREGDDEAASSAALAATEKATTAEAELEQREAEYDAFVDEAAERAVTVELHAIGRDPFRDMMAAHPPRKVSVVVDPPPDDDDAAPTTVERDHEDDVGFDVNTSTFPKALLTWIDPEEPEVRTLTLVDEPMFTPKQLEKFVGRDLADGQFEEIWAAAYWLNRGGSADPKASRYSAAPRSS
jgi:hypothetical protein